MFMGQKGDKYIKSEKAKRLYSKGTTLDDIAIILHVSKTSLIKWKKETKKENKRYDEWELAKRNDKKLVERFRSLLEREVGYAEKCEPGMINPTAVDTMSKFGAIINKMEAEDRKEVERLHQLRGSKIEYDRPKVFIENLRWIVEQLKTLSPSSLPLIVDHIPELTKTFKKQNA